MTETLLAENAILKEKIEKLEAKLNMAISDLKNMSECDTCKNYNDRLNNGLCKECSVSEITREHWEWRGV